MILIGTSTGRVLSFDPLKRTIESRFGQPQQQSEVIGIDFTNQQEDEFVFYTKSGNIYKENLFDAFASQSFSLTDKILATGVFYPNSSTSFVGEINGKIHSINTSENLGYKFFYKLAFG